jgi:hypothetical protein
MRWRRALVTLTLVSYAAMTAWFLRDTTLPAHGLWARIALPAYLASALLSVVPAARNAAPFVAFLGACLVPLAWMATIDLGQPELTVLVDGAKHALSTGSPYLPHPQTLEQVRPYFPALFMFGVPRALGLPGLLGDPRLWILGLSAVGLWRLQAATRRAPKGRSGAQMVLLLLALPVLSLNLSVSAIDIPIVVALSAAFVAARQGRWPWAGGATAAGLLMKPTVALVLLLVVVTTWRIERRWTVQYLAWSTVPAAVAICASASLEPQGFIVNAIRFPLGLTEIRSPAESPFPGVLVARTGLGVWGAIALVGVVLIACLAYAWRRPDASGVALARRSAILFTLVILTAPQSRFGYLVVPICLWAASTLLGGAAPSCKHRDTPAALARGDRDRGGS